MLVRAGMLRRLVPHAVLVTVAGGVSTLGLTQVESSDPHAHHHAAAQTQPSTQVLDEVNVEFSLSDVNGTTVTDETFRGRHFLLAFGFTRCTDVCPLMAANMAAAIRLADNDVAGIFVSVDTERDNVERTNAYASAFDEHMLGLGGSYEQIAAAASNFKVSFAVTKTQSNYTVQHSSHVFLVDPGGNLVDVFAVNANPRDIAAAVN